MVNPNLNTYDPRVPQSETIKAQNVPHVPAVQQSDAGGNAQRLAQALQGFSTSLSGLARSTRSTEKQELEKEMIAIRDTGTADPEERKVAFRKSGQDVVADTYLSNAKYDRTFPEREDNELGQLKELNGSGWLKPASSPAAGAAGARGDVVEPKPVTDDDLKNWLHDQNRIAHQSLGGPKQTLLLAKQVAFNQRNYERRLVTMNKYRDDMTDQKADTVMRSQVPEIMITVDSAGIKDPNKAVRLMQGNLKRIAVEMNAASAEDPKFVNQSLLDSLAEAATMSPQAAMAAKNLLRGTPAEGVSAFIDHKTYRSQALAITKEADNTIGAAQAGAEFQGQVNSSLKKLQDGMTLSNVGVKGIEVRGGTRSFKYSSKEVEAEISKRLEKSALDKGGVPRDVTPEAAADMLAKDFAGTGLTSPTLKGLMSKATISPEMNETQLATLKMGLFAYDSVSKHDPMNARNYVGKDESKVFDKLKVLLEAEDENGLRKYDLKDAVKRIYDHTQRGGTKMLSQFSTERFSFRKSFQDKLGPDALNDVEAEFELLHGNSLGMSKGDVSRHLRSMAEEKTKRTPKVNGSAVQLPSDIGSVERYTQVLEQSATLLAERHGLDKEKMKLIRTEGGYRVVDKATGYTVRDKKGEFGSIEISDGMIKNVDRHMAELELRKKTDKASKAVAGRNSSWRSRIQEVSEQSLADQETLRGELDAARTGNARQNARHGK